MRSVFGRIYDTAVAFLIVWNFVFFLSLSLFAFLLMRAHCVEMDQEYTP